MDQYKKSGPVKKVEKNTNDTPSSQIKHLEEKIDRQQDLIDDLQKEIRRIKSKMDAHAVIINQMKRNG
jgi:vacuolar-type H+-ATPase subunit I/STV1